MIRKYPLDKDLIMEYYKDLPDNLPDLSNKKLYDKLAETLNDNTGGLTWDEVVSTLKFLLVYTIGISMNQYAKDQDKKERESLK